MKSIIFSIVLLTSLILSKDSISQSLPQAWQPGMKLESRYGGGMTEYSYELKITDGESYLITQGEKAGKIKKKFSASQLNDLITFLREHNFEKLKSELTGPTDDKASESVLLSWDGNFMGVSEGSGSDIPDEQSDDFNAIQSHLLGLFGK